MSCNGTPDFGCEDEADPHSVFRHCRFCVLFFFVETALVVLIGILQLLLKKSATSLRLLIVYLAFLLTQIFILPRLSGMVFMMLPFLVVSFRRLFPCAMAGILLIGTTTVSELSAGLGKLRVPREVIIPLAVTLRYIPAVREDLSYIRDAMKLRKLKITKEHPFRDAFRYAECCYVPLLMSASQISEELSAAAVTRGIENPCRKTFLREGRFGWTDGIVILLLLLLLTGILKVRYFGGALF